MNDSTISDYFAGLARAIEKTEFTLKSGDGVQRQEAFSKIIDSMRSVAERRRKVMFCGNGGSAGICSHMATDFFKNGGIRALALNDSSALTCLGNDYGYEYVFSKQVEMLANPGDMLVAISSSGRSDNVLNAVQAAQQAECSVVTFSGFDDNNPLRSLGDINVYVSAPDYGYVETSHLALISAILDLHMGWPQISYP